MTQTIDTLTEDEQALLNEIVGDHKNGVLEEIIGKLHDEIERLRANASHSAVTTTTGSVIWKSGWYASRLHAIPADTVFPEGRLVTSRSICGEHVYSNPPTEWALRYVKRGVPHCKRCERMIAQNASLHRTAANAGTVPALVGPRCPRCASCRVEKWSMRGWRCRSCGKGFKVKERPNSALRRGEPVASDGVVGDSE